MRCDEVREVITIFLEGELDKETSESLKAHIDTCENCKSLLGDSIEILHFLRTIEPLPVPERVVDGILKATTKRRRLSFLPIFQPQWVFAFSVFVLSFFFFTYPKKAILFDSIEFKIHRTYSQAVKLVSKVEGRLDYFKGLRFRKISKPMGTERENLELKSEKKGTERIFISREIKNLKIFL